MLLLCYVKGLKPEQKPWKIQAAKKKAATLSRQGHCCESSVWWLRLGPYCLAQGLACMQVENSRTHRMGVYLYLSFCCCCVQSAPSVPPATLPEEIIHCQYLLTSECTRSTNAFMVHTVTRKHAHTLISNAVPHFNTLLHPPPPSVLHAQAYRCTKKHTRTCSISIQGVLHRPSVCDTHAWWPVGAERNVLLIEYDTK